ncbi:MAG: hypothetical protein ABL912_03540, partial [Novosphingobium sp.]
MLTEAKLVVLRWQDSHTFVVCPCPGFLPIAVVPLWQDEQLVVMPVWLKLAGVQALVVWQVLHCAVVLTWFADLPLAVVP